MKPLLAVAALAAGLACAPAYAMTDAECAAALTKADANADGTVTEAEGGRYFAALRIADKATTDGKLSRAAFLDHCKAGVFNLTKTDTGAPLPGANSFTENQAKDRLLAAGYINVSALAKDTNGVWRGTGSDGAKSLKVAVDFKGNVVAN
jgi:hypothetical protein